MDQATVRAAGCGSDEWAHELKFDGYRVHARLDRGDVRLLTRTGLDWTGKYPRLRRRRVRFPRGTPISTASSAGCGPTMLPPLR
ncbi:MAG: hypothetical protein WB611_31065 [Stellaceae bacterium]